MLTLIYGKDWTANRDYIFNLVAKDVAECKSNRILLVPELISHDAERRLCTVAGDTCSRYAEVLSFSRLTRRICDWCGCGLPECLDKGGRIIAMASATRQLHSKLKAYAALETKPEFLSSLIDAIDEFKRCSISSADLANASHNTEGVFSQKLEELSMILEAYDAVCHQGRMDPRDQLSWGLELLQETDFAQNHVFYIDGFPDFTLQNLAVISHFINYAPHVIISLNCDKPGTSDLAFSKAGDTAARLLRIAAQNNIPVEIVHVPEPKTPLTNICGQLFHGTIQSDSQTKSILHIAQASSIYDECVLAAEEILKHIHNGSRYREISVVCADLPKYKNMLSMTMEMCNIPMYIAGTEEILDKTVLSTVLSALDAALDGLDTKNILRYMKSALSPVSMDICDSIENYTLLWGIQGKKWLEKWTMHPAGLQDTWTDSDREVLDKLNASRSLVITPIQKLSESFRNASVLSQQVVALYTFFEDIDLQARLSTLAQQMDSVNDKRNAQILNQLWEILLTALEQMEAVLCDTHWDNDSFLRLFRLLLSQYDVGTIPPVLDAVMAGSVSAMRCQQVKHLLVIGASEGCFPSYGAASGVLSDHERETLRKMGVPLTGGASDGLEIEFSEIYSIFCGSTETAYVSCQSGLSSFIYRRLAAMAGGIDDPINILGAAAVSPMEASAYLCRENAADISADLNLEDSVNLLKHKSMHTIGEVSKEGINALYGKKLILSASQVDKQADCRMAYFLKYGLRAKEQVPVDIDPAEFGTYVHNVLELTARDVCEAGGFKAISLEETLCFAKKHSDDYITSHFSQIASERIAYLFQRNDQELMMVVEELWKELQNSYFVPVDFEVAFGEREKLPSITIPSDKMDASLRGFVDRVDAWQEGGRNYFRVVDYKTGRKDFDYCDVFNGLGLQMLLYLFTLQSQGETLLGKNPTPAGVQYFPARAPVLSVDGTLSDEEVQSKRQSEWKRKGLILNDADILSAMDNTETLTRLSCRRQKDGTITGDVATREQFKILNRYVFHLLGKMVDDIASGNVIPNPYTRGTSHNACSFCPYGDICHSSTVENRRNYKAMSSQRFWDEIDKEVSKLG